MANLYYVSPMHVTAERKVPVVMELFEDWWEVEHRRIKALMDAKNNRPDKEKVIKDAYVAVGATICDESEFSDGDMCVVMVSDYGPLNQYLFARGYVGLPADELPNSTISLIKKYRHGTGLSSRFRK